MASSKPNIATKSVGDLVTHQEINLLVNHFATKPDIGQVPTLASVEANTAKPTLTEVTALDDLKLNISSLVNNLNSTSTTAPLTANQGRILKNLIDAINTLLLSDTTTLDSLQEVVDYIELNRANLEALSIPSIAGLVNALAGKASNEALELNSITDRTRSNHIGTQDKATVSGLIESNIDQFGLSPANQLLLTTISFPLAPTSAVVAFNLNYVIGGATGFSNLTTGLTLNMAGGKAGNKCIVYSNASAIPSAVSDSKVKFKGDAYSTVAGALNVLTFTFISASRVLCENEVFLSALLPTVKGLGSFATVGPVGARTYSVDLTEASVGELMLVSLFNANVADVITPPAGWDTVASSPVAIFTRVKQVADPNTFTFTTVVGETKGVSVVYFENTVYAGLASLVIGTPTPNTGNTGKTITGITLPQNRLVLCLIASGGNNNQATLELPTDATTVDVKFDNFSPFRSIKVFSVIREAGTTENFIYTVPIEDQNGGILIAIRS
jgi:hypothetical protein